MYFTSKPLSKALHMFFDKERSWLIQESLGLNPVWFSEIRMVSIRYLKILLYIIISETFAIGSDNGLYR